LLKIKYNNIKHQAENSTTCGHHCIRFLSKRFKNIPFKTASLFDKSVKHENEIKKLFNRYI